METRTYKCSRCRKEISHKGYCNRCQRKYMKTKDYSEKAKIYYIQNRDKILARNKAYKESHKEEVRTYQKAYRDENKEVIKAYQKAYRDE